MAYAAVASLSQTIHLVLDYHKRSVSPEFEDQITSLDKDIIFLRSFLEDCPDEADSWEDIICEVTNLAEDIIELLMSDSLLQSTVISSKSKFGTRSYEVCHDFDELERVIKEIESIAKGVKERHKEAVDDSNDDLTQIISQLKNEFYSLRTIAIVGRGGVGKTTLARNVFNHPEIVEHFQIRAWATVTEDFSLRGVLSSLLRSMNVSNAGKLFESEDELSISINRILWRKRYLFVLDDVYEAGDFTTNFPNDYTRSRIILTTRSQSLATQNHISYIHKMNAMNFDQSWNLFQKNIFKGNRCPPRLEYMGKMITKSCRGLHLMIAVVSGILAVDQTEAAWEDIAENLKTSINFGDHEHSLHILYLSHRQLPHHLRPILLYLGIFQKGREIRFSKLIKLWMAEGFLNEGGSYKCLEDMCEEYVEDLVRRRLVVVGKRKSDGRIKSFSIHDLVWEMCIKQAKVDNFFHVSVEATKMNERRVRIHDCDLDLLKNVCGSIIRTIICLEGNHQVLQQSLGYFRLLRILDLSNVYDFLEEYDFPGQVFELFHLRHLAFGYPFNISEAISNLENLQTLVIHPRLRQVVKLPVEIWKMPQLRHLVVVSCELPCQKEAMNPLENLQTLSKAVNLTCSEETLKMMPNLKKLCITFTPWRDPGEDYRLHNLIYLKELEVLKIEASNRPKLHRISPPPFHPTLRKLSLKGLGVPWEEMKTVASLPNLQVLKLRDDACIGNTWETSEGGFSQLTFLLIYGSDLKHWITRSTHFPKLKCLLLHHCWCMSEVPHDIGEIQTLESIQVDRLNKVQLQSVKRIQQDQQSLGSDCIRIHEM